MLKSTVRLTLVTQVYGNRTWFFFSAPACLSDSRCAPMEFNGNHMESTMQQQTKRFQLEARPADYMWSLKTASPNAVVLHHCLKKLSRERVKIAQALDIFRKMEAQQKRSRHLLHPNPPVDKVTAVCYFGVVNVLRSENGSLCRCTRSCRKLRNVRRTSPQCNSNTY